MRGEAAGGGEDCFGAGESFLLSLSFGPVLSKIDRGDQRANVTTRRKRRRKIGVQVLYFRRVDSIRFDLLNKKRRKNVWSDGLFLSYDQRFQSQWLFYFVFFLTTQDAILLASWVDR